MFAKNAAVVIFLFSFLVSSTRAANESARAAADKISWDEKAGFRRNNLFISRNHNEFRTEILRRMPRADLFGVCVKKKNRAAAGNRNSGKKVPQTIKTIDAASVLLPERFGPLRSLAPSAPDLTGFSRVPSTFSFFQF